MVMDYEKKWIKPGIDVAYIDVPDLKMKVQDFVRRSKVVEGKVVGEIIIGVKCFWFDDKKKYQWGTFHSKQLLPWEVAVGGPVEISKFLNRE